MIVHHRVLVAVVTVCLAGPAMADEGPRFGLGKLSAKIFGGGSASVTAEPAVVPAPAAASSPAPPAGPAATASLPPAGTAPTVPVPTPRLRPTPAAIQPSALPVIATAPATALTMPVAAPLPAKSVSAAMPTVAALTVTASAMGGVDPVVTGAVNASQDATPAPAAGTLAPRVVDRSVTPAPSASLPLPPAAPISDGLLGDPAASFPVAPTSQPQAAAPQTISLPRPAAIEGGGEAAPEVDPGEPYMLVRQLQALQDRTAHGSVEALAAQRSFIASIDRAFAAASPAAWQDARNAVAAVGFVLSGGPPTILKVLSTTEPKPPVDERLVKGVLAYAEGRESEAYGYLNALDATAMPPSIGAPIAMAQSALAVRTDPQQAMRLLAVARLLAPGTLVEEAAIRRQIFVADQLRDDQQVQSLARQYLDRFRRSVYAGNFRDRFAAALSHMDFINDPAQFPRLDDMLASVEPDARAELYLTIALAGVVKGQLNAARLAATRALPLTAAGSTSQSRARLYRAAVTIASAKTFDAAVADYAAVERTRLQPQDLQLADAVAVAIASIKSGTDVSRATLTIAPDAEPGSAVIGRAADALKRADDALKVAAK